MASSTAGAKARAGEDRRGVSQGADHEHESSAAACCGNRAGEPVPVRGNIAQDRRLRGSEAVLQGDHSEGLRPGQRISGGARVSGRSANHADGGRHDRAKSVTAGAKARLHRGGLFRAGSGTVLRGRGSGVPGVPRQASCGLQNSRQEISHCRDFERRAERVPHRRVVPEVFLVGDRISGILCWMRRTRGWPRCTGCVSICTSASWIAAGSTPCRSSR